MKRREFSLLLGSGVAAAGLGRPVLAQAATADATLLTTTLTPVGAERAGNADGSIPAWTGGLVTPPLPPSENVIVQLFTDELPLYTVDSSNMAQYSGMLSEGTEYLMTKYGFKIKVFQTHRTAAAPQYVYDNIAQNVTRAKLEPAGGRFGFLGAYGGIPFPIPDADPDVAGAQIIWNHLVQWPGYSYKTDSTAFVVIGGRTDIAFGGYQQFLAPYYDPNGSAETYQGYYGLIHQVAKAPSSLNGQEYLIWHTSNSTERPDIVWELLTGQGRVRKAPNEAYDTPNSQSNGINNLDDATGFYGSPQKYDWKLLGKKEMLVPYNCNAITASNPAEFFLPHFPNPDVVRWEKHRVWVVEATLHPGQFNTTARRMCYMDEDNWGILYSDCYDAQNNLVKTLVAHNKCVPSLPGVIFIGFACWDLINSNYSWVGGLPNAQIDADEWELPQAMPLFEPEQMAANASF
jgi:hypothetical protein